MVKGKPARTIVVKGKPDRKKPARTIVVKRNLIVDKRPNIT